MGLRSRQDQATSAPKKADFILLLWATPIPIPPDCSIPGDLLTNNICFCQATLLSERNDWLCMLVGWWKGTGVEFDTLRQDLFRVIREGLLEEVTLV